MEAGNLICETANCGRLATVFGIRGTQKLRSCSEHIVSSLIEKEMQVVDIAGYYFISNSQDSVEYEGRKALTAKGRGNVTVLITKCREELVSAHDAIDRAKEKVAKVVESRFEEIKLAADATFIQVTTQLADLQANFDQFLASKENQLLPAAKLVCMELTVIPLFMRFGICDISDRISAELNSSWAVATTDLYTTLTCLDASQRNAAIASALTEASEYAKKGILEALQYADSLIGGAVSFDKSRDQVVEEFWKFERQRIAQKSHWLRKSWNLRYQSGILNEATIEVGRQLARLLYSQYGEFSEAENILQGFHSNSALHSRPPADSMSLCNDLLELCFARADYQQIESFGLSVLQAYQSANLPAAHYWTALLYVTYSMRQQGKHQEASATFAEWSERIGLDGTKLAEMLRLLTSGIEDSFNDNKSQAEVYLLQARRIGTSHYPTSTFTALACYRLTVVCSENTREQYHRQAHSLYEVISPKCAHAAVNLTNIGTVWFKKQQLKEAEKCMTQAQSILETAAPKSIHAAKNLTNLGVLLYMKDQWGEAERPMKVAESILETEAPMSENAAINYFYMGKVSEARGRIEEAIARYLKSASLYAGNGKTEKQAEIEQKIAHLKQGRR